MKAMTYTEYGSSDVLKIVEIEKPSPEEDQVLVKVHAASINSADYRKLDPRPVYLRLMFGGLFRPKDTRLGIDVAGQVEVVGEAVTQFQPGDEVFGCAHGTFAEYILAREANLAPKPSNVSHEEASAVPVAALTALQGIRHAGGIQPGQKVLIQGASGGVGIFALQLAKAYGAEVTAVCSPRNLDMARSLGADHVIDYTQDDFTRGQHCYHLIFAVNGYHPLSAYRRALCPQGTYLCAGGTMSQILQSLLLGPMLSRKGDKKLSNMGIATVNQEDLLHLGELLQAGKIAPVIDHSYPLDEIAAAFRYIEDEHAQGKVVITMEKQYNN